MTYEYDTPPCPVCGHPCGFDRGKGRGKNDMLQTCGRPKCVRAYRAVILKRARTKLWYNQRDIQNEVSH
jgi:hypothetical protein